MKKISQKWSIVDWRSYAQRLLTALETNQEYDVGTLVNELKRLRTGNPADYMDVLYTEAREALDSLAFDNYGAIEDIIDDLTRMLQRRTAAPGPFEQGMYDDYDDGSYYIPGFYAAIRAFNRNERSDPTMSSEERVTAFHYLPSAQHWDVFADLIGEHKYAGEFDDFQRAVYNPTTKQLAILSYKPTDVFWKEEKREWVRAAKEAGVKIEEFGAVRRTDDPYRAGGWLDYDFVPESAF